MNTTKATMRAIRRTVCLLIPALVLVVAGCGGGGDSQGGSSATSTPAADGLTQDELTNGIGPVRSVTFGEIDAALVEQGTELYSLKCSMCHKVAERYIGPPLNDLLAKRTPAYVMNMMLNPVEMTQKHPEARKLLAEYSAPMADQSLTEDEARAILEYLRTVQN